MSSSILHRNRRPVFLKFRSSPGLIITTASFAVFTDIFLYAVIVPVLPFSLTDKVGVSEDQVQYWVSISLAVYGAALLASSPVWGYLADRIRNRQIPMLIGLVLLTGSTIFLCVASTVGMLLAGRVLQGLSAALTWTVGLALVIDTVDPSQVGIATGWIGVAMSMGILVAPLLGGVVYGKGGYYAVFGMCFGLLVVDIVLRLAIIEVKDAKRWISAEQQQQQRNLGEASDMEGCISHRPTTSVSHAGTESNKSDELGSADQTASKAGKHQTPTASGWRGAIMPLLHLLRKPRLLAALLGTLVEAIVATSFDSTLPLFVKDLFKWDSIGAGLIFLPIAVPTFLSPLVGMIGDRYGPKWLATSGFIVATPSIICMRFVDENTLSHKIMLGGMLAGAGVAMTLVFGPLMAEITWSVMEDHSSEARSTAPVAQAYGLYNVAFSAGSLIGPILGGLVRDRYGWGTVCWVLGIFTILTAVSQALWIGEPVSLRGLRRIKSSQ